MQMRSWAKTGLSALLIAMIIGCGEGVAESSQVGPPKSIREQCSRKTVIVEISNISIEVPKNALISVEAGEPAVNPERSCEVKRIQKVKNVRWQLFEIDIQLMKAGSGNTTYHSAQKWIFATKQNKAEQILSNGTKKISRPGIEIYVLPEFLTPTANKEPVVFKCINDFPNESFSKFASCNVSYEHPAGFKIAYRFARIHHSPDTFLQLDLEKRKQLKSMIKAAQE